MKLTQNFHLAEMTKSVTASKYDIPNMPNEDQKNRLTKLCQNILQPLRNYLNLPITINSAFRSHALNKRIPGASKTSQHMKGEAADIECYSIADNMELANLIVNINLDYDQLILEVYDPEVKNSGWVHVSHAASGLQRKEKLYYIKYRKKILGFIPKFTRFYIPCQGREFTVAELKSILRRYKIR